MHLSLRSASANSSLRQFRVFNIPPPSLDLLSSPPLRLSLLFFRPNAQNFALGGSWKNAKVSNTGGAACTYLLLFRDERSLSKFPNGTQCKTAEGTRGDLLSLTLKLCLLSTYGRWSCRPRSVYLSVLIALRTPFAKPTERERASVHRAPTENFFAVRPPARRPSVPLNHCCRSKPQI